MPKWTAEQAAKMREKAAAAKAAKKAAKLKKSGDSLLADAHAAREDERKHGHEWSPEERREHLIAEVQDAPEVKKAQGDKQGADLAAASIAALTAMVQGMSDRLITLEGKTKKVDTSVPLMRCPTCKQLVRISNGAGVCTGKHSRVFVGPRNGAYWRDFHAGVIWNGIQYRGNTILPDTIVDAVLGQVALWENMKRQEQESAGNHLEFDTEKGKKMGSLSLIA